MKGELKICNEHTKLNFETVSLNLFLDLFYLFTLELKK